MTINYAKLFNRRVTPRSQPIPGSTQVRNSNSGFTLADPNDRGMLDVVGFDSTVPAVIADFVRE